MNSTKYLKKSKYLFFSNCSKKLKRKEGFQTHSMRPVSPNAKTRKRLYKIRKLEANILDEHRGKKLQQNISKPNSAIKRIIYHNQVGFIPQMRGLFSTCKSISVIQNINKMKDKNHIITTIDAEKAFDKI